MPAKKKPVAKKTVRRTMPVKKAAVPKTKLPRITYATLTVTADDDKQYEAAVANVRAQLGKHFTNFVNGEARESSVGEFAHASPVDTNCVVSYFPKGTREDVRAAIRAARQAYADWSATDYRDRIKIMRRAADLIVERRFDISAWMAFEVGKNRAESLAEVNESAELIRYYCERMEFHKGFVLLLESPGAGQKTVSVLRPYGVWGVIAPWNFPMALAMGMSAGALIAGNTVVFKPSSESPVAGYEIYRALTDAGLPKGAFNLMVGPGSTVGAEMQENPGIDALVFTGSKEIGMQIYHNFAKKWPKPTIAEMGGKNPAIVTASADLDEAAEGVMRAAFGYDGQKCSACSRVYVDKRVKDKFIELLVEYTKNRVKVGDPVKKETFMGPVINAAAVETYLRAAQDARLAGGTFHFGGTAIKEGDLANGFFVEP
ncbi:partial 1-pyrroline-5-carboxylate dehydrogenase, partial [Anaerolineae bacterium]